MTIQKIFSSRAARWAAIGLAAGATMAVDLPAASAQEIQLTGPLAGAPAVRRLRLRREGRFEVAPQATFTLLDEYRRTIMPGIRASYHFWDLLGASLFFGYGIQYNAGLADELQEKAVDNRQCAGNPDSLACKRTRVNLCQGPDCLADTQLAQLQWMVAPQLNLVPFRGKVSLFGAVFVDTDVNVFIGPAIIGLQERKECASPAECGDAGSFELEGRVTAAPTFGLGLNFHPLDYLSFGTEFRGVPFAWNTSGFDKAGGDPDGEFPDDIVNGDDQSVQFNPMMTVYVAMQLPMEIEVSD